MSDITICLIIVCIYTLVFCILADRALRKKKISLEARVKALLATSTVIGGMPLAAIGVIKLLLSI